MQDSVYYSTPQTSYREYIKPIADKTKTVPQILSTFRESQLIPKEFLTLTAKELADDFDKWLKLIHNLRANMQPESPRSMLPFNKELRKQELILELEASYSNLDVSKARANIVVGSYPEDRSNVDRLNAQMFNYRLEVVMIPLTNTEGGSSFICSINSIPALDWGETYFDFGNGSYEWTDKKGKYIYHAKSLREILNNAGFGNVGGGWKKSPCLVYIDLITPCPSWQGSAGKTHIDLVPYQKVIAETVFEMACKMPSIRTNPGSSLERYSSTGRTGEYMEEYLMPFLRERRKAVQADPSLKITDRLTQSSVWYRIEPKMRADGFEPKKDWATTRRSLQNAIRQAIKRLWGRKVTREGLGIVAKARAVLYFNGETHPITLESIQELSKTRTRHLAIIEKEGVTDVLLELAKPFRIALVATAGKPVEYAKDLAKACKTNNIRVCTIYDDDLTGRESADEFRRLGLRVPRIGVDKKTVKWLQQNSYPIKLEDVLEEYRPQHRHYWKYDEYLKTQKIEIDMIIAKVGAGALWKWILYKLTETFPEPVDYRDIVDEPMPEQHFPKEFQDLQNYLRDLCGLSYSKRWEKIQEDDLAEVSPKDGLMNIDEKNDEIFNELGQVVNEDQHIKDVSKSMKELLDSLPSIKDLKNEYDAK